MELRLHTDETPWELCKYIITTVIRERKRVLKDAEKTSDILLSEALYLPSCLLQ